MILHAESGFKLGLHPGTLEEACCRPPYGCGDGEKGTDEQCISAAELEDLVAGVVTELSGRKRRFHGNFQVTDMRTITEKLMEGKNNTLLWES